MLHRSDEIAPLEIALYTAVLGDCNDAPGKLLIGPGFVFNDRAPQWQPNRGWVKRRLPTPAGLEAVESTRRAARWLKLHPFELFPEAKYWMWVDGSHTPKWAPKAYLTYLGDADLCTFRHVSRNCVYQEAETCKQMKKDDPRVIDMQMARYRKTGFPYNAGLAETTVVLSRNCERVRYFFSMWAEEMRDGSVRDQLSFPIAADRAGLDWNQFPGSAWDQTLFIWVKHW